MKRGFAFVCLMGLLPGCSQGTPERDAPVSSASGASDESPTEPVVLDIYTDFI